MKFLHDLDPNRPISPPPPTPDMTAETWSTLSTMQAICDRSELAYRTATEEKRRRIRWLCSLLEEAADQISYEDLVALIKENTPLMYKRFRMEKLLYVGSKELDNIMRQNGFQMMDQLYTRTQKPYHPLRKPVHFIHDYYPLEQMNEIIARCEMETDPKLRCCPYHMPDNLGLERVKKAYND